MKTVTMESLVGGKHILNTAAIISEHTEKREWYSSGEQFAGFSIGIDYKTYTFYEDPSDGYRSYMGEIIVEPGLNMKLSGAAEINREVVIKWHTAEDKDIILIVDAETGHVWAELGTDHVDDYYPCCVMSWMPMTPEVAETKVISEKTAKGLAEAFGYEEVMIYARRQHVEHVASYRNNLS